MSELKKAKQIAERVHGKGRVTKALDALGAPQRKLASAAAEALGLKPEAESADNFANIADAAGDALGVPRDSVVGNAVKAGGVALAETFADPLGFIPLGKVAKGIKGLSKLKPVQAAAKVAQESGAVKKAAEIVQSAKTTRAQEIDKLNKALKARDMQLITDETSRATDGYRKQMAAKVAEEAQPVVKLKPEAPPQGLAQKSKDRALMLESIREAERLNIPEERKVNWIKMRFKAHGGGR